MQLEFPAYQFIYFLSFCSNKINFQADLIGLDYSLTRELQMQIHLIYWKILPLAVEHQAPFQAKLNMSLVSVKLISLNSGISRSLAH
jgi:hypothetical protein